MKKRKDISLKYKWNLNKYFESDENWEAAFKDFSAEIKRVLEFDKKLFETKNILNCFRFISQLDEKVEALYVYANCIKDLDVADPKSQERRNKIEAKLTEYSVLSSFINPQLTKLSDDFLKELLKNKDFKDFKKVIREILREKRHTLSEENEKILSQISSFSRDFSLNFSNFENGDLKFKNILNKEGKSLPMSQSLASNYLRSSDNVLRENAYKELHLAFGRFNNFLTSNYLASVKKDVFYARVRKFDSALDSALFYEEVNSKVYELLVDKVRSNISLDSQYFELKRKISNLKKFKICDVYYNPIKLQNKYSYEEGFDIVCNALKILGEDYISDILEMKNNRHIDVFPNENKYSGAYQTAAFKKPPLVLLNFSGNFDNISTLAHELGHAMHSKYSDGAQTIFNSRYPIFLAEIASTVNECLLNDYMYENSKNINEKIFYINEFLSRFHATIFRQTMFADFEHKIHNLIENNLPVSSEILNQKYYDLVKTYFGKKVKLFDCVKFEWSRIPHFFTAFYVYKYATGLISALNIVHNLKAGKITVNDYKRFLSSGCIDNPLDLLKIVKVDLEDKKTFDIAFEKAKENIKKLKKLSQS